jgi:hypothetical protein
MNKQNKRKLKENWKKSVERVYKVAASNAVRSNDLNTEVVTLETLKTVCEEQLERGVTL